MSGSGGYPTQQHVPAAYPVQQPMSNYPMNPYQQQAPPPYAVVQIPDVGNPFHVLKYQKLFY